MDISDVMMHDVLREKKIDLMNNYYEYVHLLLRTNPNITSNNTKTTTSDLYHFLSNKICISI